jgi:hypothetical protein
MTLPAVADGLVALLFLTSIVCLFYGPWQDVCIDLSRQFIFEKRDQLFDMAADGRISFESETYRAARDLMNGMLRYAHELTWTQMVVHSYVYGATPRRTRLRDLLAAEKPEIRKEIEGILRECSAVMAGMMAMKSIFIGPFCFLVCIGMLCTAGMNYLVRFVARQKKFEPINETIQATSADYADDDFALAA